MCVASVRDSGGSPFFFSSERLRVVANLAWSGCGSRTASIAMKSSESCKQVILVTVFVVQYSNLPVDAAILAQSR